MQLPVKGFQILEFIIFFATKRDHSLKDSFQFSSQSYSKDWSESHCNPLKLQQQKNTSKIHLSVLQLSDMQHGIEKLLNWPWNALM